jgi:hypothetical protein
MSYVLSGFVVTPSTGLDMVAGHRAMPIGVSAISPVGITGPGLAPRYRGHGGTTEGSYAFGDLGQALENGEQKVLMVLLLFAAYMNLMLNLMSAPKRTSR